MTSLRKLALPPPLYEVTPDSRQRLPRLECFEAFLGYRRWRTLAETSRQLHCHPDVLSERLRFLEEWFEHTLFERSTPYNRLTAVLTPFGERCLPVIQQTVSSFDDLQTLRLPVKRAAQVTIALAECVAMSLLPAVRNALYQRSAADKGGYRFTVARSLVARNDVVHKKADFAVFVGRDAYQDDELIVEPLVRSPMCLFAAALHPLAQYGTAVPFHRLAREIFALPKEQSIYRLIFDSMMRRAQITIPYIDTFSSFEAIKVAVAAGPGIGILPYFAIAAEVKKHHLAIIPLDEDLVYIQIVLAYRAILVGEPPILREARQEFRRQALALPQPE